MNDAAQLAAGIYKELGAFAFLLIVGALAFAYLVWRIVQAQDKLADSQNRMLEKFSSHDQRSADMYGTCQEHSRKMDDLRCDVKDLKTDVTVLKERVG